MSGFKHTGAAQASASGEYAEYAQMNTAIAAAVTAINARQFSFRNKLINGNFAINQRAYVSGTATGGANQYTLDRWRVVTAGQNLAFAASGNGNQVTAPAGGIEQVIEGANIEGGVYTLSWTGTATATVNGTAIVSGAQTASLTANTDVTVKFSGGTVSLAQFEIGSIATVFEQRNNVAELEFCQRYYEKLPPIQFSAYQLGTASIAQCIAFKVTKRIAPAIGGTWAYSNASGGLYSADTEGAVLLATASISGSAVFTLTGGYANSEI